MGDVKKRILVVYYSQAGQTLTAIENLLTGIKTTLPQASVTAVRLEAENPYPFPWKMTEFFRAFPNCVNETPQPLKPIDLNPDADFDLVIIGYPVWFLSLALPIQAFFQSPVARVLRGKRVIGLLTSRNLWHSASLQFRKHVTRLGGHFSGQISLWDKSPSWASFVTTPRWMLTGRKNAFWFFPAAGVSEADFSHLITHGQKLGSDLLENKPVHASLGLSLYSEQPSLYLMDKIGRKFFETWGKIFRTIAPHRGLKQDSLLVVFRASLIITILSIAPLTKILELGFRREWKPKEGS